MTPGDHRMRFGPGDFVTSKKPVSDTLQEYTKILLTSNDGFMFKPELNHIGAKRNVLCSFDIPNTVGVSSDKYFDAEGLSSSPYGDVNFSAEDPQPHQMQSSAPLRDGSMSFELQTRDGEVRQADLPSRTN